MQKTLVVLFFLIIGHVWDAFAQTIATKSARPSIFVAFEKFGGVREKTPSRFKASGRISLRLRNETHRAIAVDADGTFTEDDLLPYTLSDGTRVSAVPEGLVVELCYEAEAVPVQSVSEFERTQVPRQWPSAYSCKWISRRSGPRTVVWIRPGTSVVFSVPEDLLTPGLMIYTRFHYEWESTGGQIKADEPSHSVYFYASDLPSKRK